MTNDKQMVMRLLQDKKDFSIAFYNATNAAINILPYFCKVGITSKEDTEKEIITWRDFFLVEHAKYRQEVIEPMNDEVTKQAIISDIVKSLDSVKNLSQLTKLWIQLSEDERHNDDIISLFKDKKATYEKA